MIKKISITIISRSEFQENLIRMIASNNSGEVAVSLHDIKGYLKSRIAEFPILYLKTVLHFEDLENSYKLAIEEKGKITLELTETLIVEPLSMDIKNN